MEERLRRVAAALRDAGIDALLAGPSADLYWLTGYHALPLERLTLLVHPASGDPVLIVPELEHPRAAASSDVEIIAWSETDDPLATLISALDERRIDPKGQFAVQSLLAARFLLPLQDRLPGAAWFDAEPIMRRVRQRKSPDEIAALAEAAAAIDRVHARTSGLLRPGRTEREVARDLADAILDEHDAVEFVIVASGPNGASPHHESSERPLERGDAIVVDIGGRRGGYCSDMTRNYVLGEAGREYHDVHDVVQAAQQSGVDAATAGRPAEEVDAACRQVIADAGYGEQFIHRTGHGIGIEPHEHPYIVSGNDEPLQPGMTFSIEPGIYLPGRFGIRIEDIVVMEEDRARRLNRRPHRAVEVTDV